MTAELTDEDGLELLLLYAYAVSDDVLVMAGEVAAPEVVHCDPSGPREAMMGTSGDLICESGRPNPPDLVAAWGGPEVHSSRRSTWSGRSAGDRAPTGRSGARGSPK